MKASAVKQVNVELPLALHARMKSLAARRSIPMRRAFLEAIERYLVKEERR